MSRILDAAALAIREGHVLHVRADARAAPRPCHPALPAIDLTVGPHPQTRRWSIEDYSPVVRIVGDRLRRRAATRRNEHEEHATPEAAIKDVLLRLGGREEPLQTALRARFADEFADADEARANAVARFVRECVQMRAGRAARIAGIRFTVGGGSGHGVER